MRSVLGHAETETPVPIVSDPWRNATNAALGILLITHVTLAWISRQILIRGQDDAWYALLARSLREFRYVDLFAVGQPGHQLYPPGYPALLAIWSFIGGENVDWLIGLSLLSSVTVVALCFLIMRGWLHPVIAVAGTAAIALNPHVIERAGALMSEAPFALITVSQLYLMLRTGRTYRTDIITGALAIAAALTRTVGITMLIALGAHWLLQRRWRAVVVLVVASACTVGVWLAWTAVALEQFDGKSYIADATNVVAHNSFADILVRRVTGTLRFYATRGMPYILAVPTVRGTLVDNVLSVTVMSVGLAAGLFVALVRWRPAALYLLAFGGLLLFWPWRVERYLIPIAPIVIIVVLLGHWIVFRRFGPRMGLVAATAYALALGVNGGYLSLRRAAAVAPCDRKGPMPQPDCLTEDHASFFAALQYINDEVPADAVIVAAKSAPLYYYTGRQTPSVAGRRVIAQRPEQFLPYLRQLGAEYILLGNLYTEEKGFLRNNLAANCELLDLLAVFPPRTFIFRVRSNRDISPDREACRAIEIYDDEVKRRPLPR